MRNKYLSDLEGVEKDVVKMYASIVSEYKRGLITLKKAIDNIETWYQYQCNLVTGLFMFDLIPLNSYDEWETRNLDTYRKYMDMLF